MRTQNITNAKPVIPIGLSKSFPYSPSLRLKIIDAVNIMEKSKVNSFLVVNEENELVGIVNLQDLLKGKVI